MRSWRPTRTDLGNLSLILLLSKNTRNHLETASAKWSEPYRTGSHTAVSFSCGSVRLSSAVELEKVLCRETEEEILIIHVFSPYGIGMILSGLTNSIALFLFFGIGYWGLNLQLSY